MIVLLDTHVWVWAEEDPSRLGTKTRKVLLDRQTEIFVSPISTLEIAQLIFKGRIHLTRTLEEWLSASAQNLGYQIAPFSHEIAMYAYALPGNFHPDPADRILVSSARFLDAMLITMDQRILDYPSVRSLDART